MKSNFEQAWDSLAFRVHRTARGKGWWDAPKENGLCRALRALGFMSPAAKANDAEKIALMHSELSEAIEALRVGNPASKKTPEFSQVEEELADVVVRIMDYAVFKDFDIAGAMRAKIEYNEGRAYHHGGKAF